MRACAQPSDGWSSAVCQCVVGVWLRRCVVAWLRGCVVASGHVQPYWLQTDIAVDPTRGTRRMRAAHTYPPNCPGLPRAHHLQKDNAQARRHRDSLSAVSHGATPNTSRRGARRRSCNGACLVVGVDDGVECRCVGEERRGKHSLAPRPSGLDCVELQSVAQPRCCVRAERARASARYPVRHTVHR